MTTTKSIEQLQAEWQAAQDEVAELSLKAVKASHEAFRLAEETAKARDRAMKAGYRLDKAIVRARHNPR